MSAHAAGDGYRPFPHQESSVTGGDVRRQEIAELFQRLSEYSTRDIRRVLDLLAADPADQPLVDALQLGSSASPGARLSEPSSGSGVLSSSSSSSSSAAARIAAPGAPASGPAAAAGGPRHVSRQPSRLALASGGPSEAINAFGEILNDDEFENWNEQFQQILLRPAVTQDQILDRVKHIDSISRKFADFAGPLARTIIEELSLADAEKTVRPLPLARGVAGGVKYKTRGLFLKLACNHRRMYASVELSMKAATHERKGLQALLGCNVSNIHFPLVTVVDYLGHRLFVESVLPISHSTLVYGSDDGLAHAVSTNREIAMAMQQAAHLLNLKPHLVQPETGPPVLMHACADLEGHRARDGRLYVVDVARLMPPDPDPGDGPRGAVLCRLLRPELVRANPVPLSSDAFTRWGASNASEHNAEVERAADRLRSVVVPALAAALDRRAAAVLGEATANESDASMSASSSCSASPVTASASASPPLSSVAPLAPGPALASPLPVATTVAPPPPADLQAVLPAVPLSAAACSPPPAPASGPTGPQWLSPPTPVTTPQFTPLHLPEHVTPHAGRLVLGPLEAPFAGPQLVAELHRAGVNLRYLGQLRQHVHHPELRALLLSEIVARTALKMLRAWARAHCFRQAADAALDPEPAGVDVAAYLMAVGLGSGRQEPPLPARTAVRGDVLGEDVLAFAACVRLQGTAAGSGRSTHRSQSHGSSGDPTSERATGWRVGLQLPAAAAAAERELVDDMLVPGEPGMAAQSVAVERFKAIAALLMSLLCYDGDPVRESRPAREARFLSHASRDAFFEALRPEIERRFSHTFNARELALPGSAWRVLFRPYVVLSLLERYAGLTLASETPVAAAPCGSVLARPLQAADIAAVHVVTRSLHVQSPVDAVAQSGRRKLYAYYWNELYLHERASPDSPQVALLLQSLAELFSSDGSFAAARSLYERARRMFKRSRAVRPVHYAACLLAYAQCLRKFGDYEQASRYAQKAMDAYVALLPGHRRDVAVCAHLLGWIELSRGNLAGAERILRDALRTWEHVPHPHRIVHETELLLSRVLVLAAKLDEASELQQRVLRAVHAAPSVPRMFRSTVLTNQAALFLRWGRWDEAERASEQAVQLRAEALGAEHPHTLRAACPMGQAAFARGCYDRAADIFSRLLTAFRERDDRHFTAVLEMNLGRTRQRQHRLDEALSLFQCALHTLEERLDHKHPVVITAQFVLAETLVAAGALDQGESLLRRALQMRAALLGAPHRDYPQVDKPAQEQEVGAYVPLDAASLPRFIAQFSGGRVAVPCHPAMVLTASEQWFWQPAS